MRKIFSITILTAMILSLLTPTALARETELQVAINRTAQFILETVSDPQVDPVGGEWAVIGLARSGLDVPDSYFENYLQTVENYVRERNGVLHDRRITEYSRVILALTASGFDPRDVAGFDLTARLSDFEATIWQGINGPIWALIALDSGNYPNDQRDNFIAEILRRQLNDGGWHLSDGRTDETRNRPSDVNITAMALQALARYQDRPDVKAAIDRALVQLSQAQDEQGGFSSWGSDNVETTVQVLVGITELGLSINDPQFIKNGNTMVDNILSFANADGSFRHQRDGSTGNNQMSTEQAFYGLIAAQRSLDGRNSLYDMSDVVRRGTAAITPITQPQAGQGLPNKHAGVSVMPVVSPGRTFADIQNHPNQNAIEALASRGIISGMSETAFAPNETMTRAQFAAIVTRSLGLTLVVETPFTDVPEAAWFAGPVSTAFHYGIVTGTTATTFNPNGLITRQEAAVMVSRAAALAGMRTERTDEEIRNTLSMFGDQRAVASWARTALAFCFDVGILNDYEFDISPNEAITRSEVAQMLYNMLSAADLT